MKSLAILALAGLLPVVAVTGYLLNTDPAPLSPLQSMQRALKLDEGSRQQGWKFVVTKGKAKGQSADAVMVASTYSDRALRTMGAREWKFLVQECSLYSTSGNPSAVDDAEAAMYCRQREVSRAEVMKHAKSVRHARAAS